MHVYSDAKRIAVASAIGIMTMASPAAAIVINGTDSATDSDYQALAGLYTSVGQFHTTDATNQYAASGVIVAQNWVLTAGHVADGMNSMDFYLDGGGSWGSFTGRTGYVADQWITYPKWSGNLSSGYDIALVHFNDDLTAHNSSTADGAFTGTIATLYDGSGEIGKVGTSVGYGMTGTGATGATTFDGLKRAGDNSIDATYNTPGKPRDPNRILLSDFDNGTSGDNSFGSAIPVPMESMIAPGDSGGGLFMPCDTNSNNTDYNECLAGITSFGWGLIDGDPNSDFGDAAGYTRVSPFLSWIDSIINPQTSSGSGGGSQHGGGKKSKANVSLAAASIADVPEPGSLALLGVGLLGLVTLRRGRTA